jgi:hypothetical protein
MIEKEFVYIVVSGKVVLRNHGPSYQFEIIDIATPGTVLNQDGVSSMSCAIYVVYSTEAIIAKLHNHEFKSIWESTSTS